jgi:hypothetical protein
MVPVLGLRLQVTAVLPVLATVAVNCWVCERPREAATGERLTVTGGFMVTHGILGEVVFSTTAHDDTHVPMSGQGFRRERLTCRF